MCVLQLLESALQICFDISAKFLEHLVRIEWRWNGSVVFTSGGTVGCGGSDGAGVCGFGTDKGGLVEVDGCGMQLGWVVG